MDAQQFIQAHPNEADAVARRAGTTLVYFRMIGWGHKRPSPRLARALENASGGRMTKAELRPDIWEPTTRPEPP